MKQLNQRYNDFVDNVITNGDKIDSRFGETIEQLSVQFQFEPGEILARKGQNLKIAFAETIQLLAGTWDASAFKKYAPNSDRNLFSQEMAYGPRTYGYLEKLMHELARNRNSRQAYLFIGRPGEETTANLPCTLGLQYLIRNDKLYCNAFMRSLDLLKGLPVDVVMFGSLSQMISNCLSIEPATIMLTAGSGHVYTNDVLDQKLPLPNGRVRTFELPRFDTHGKYVQWSWSNADWHWGDIPDGISLCQPS